MHHNEHNLWYFWRQINQTYFKKIDENEQDKINQLEAKLEQPFHKIQEAKYSDYTSFFSVKSCLNKQSILEKFEKREVASLYYKTLLKHIKLSHLLYKAYDNHNVNYQKLASIHLKKQKYMNQIGGKKSMTYLIEENKLLDLLINKVEQIIEINSKQTDEIGDEMERMEEELSEINVVNQQQFSQLKNKIDQSPQAMVLCQNQQKKGRKRKSLSIDINQEAVNEIQKQYLKNIILKLEQRQVADSITKVVSMDQVDKNNFLYQVAFEQALTSNFQNIDEETMMELDKMSLKRDLSLFRFFNIPQKTRFSHIAQNFFGISYISQNRLKINNYAHKNLVPFMKKQAIQTEKQDPIINKFDSCHHCRMLFKEENLMSCNYRSGTMGLPIINASMTDPNIYQQIDNENQQTRRQVPSRKRNTYSMYARKSKFFSNENNFKDGELVCKRKFCRQCLKQCYEFNIGETLGRNDWVCPFCQGICYCTRCQRNDILNKLKQIYQLLGGNLIEIQESSLLEKYVKPREEEFFYKKKSQAHGYQVNAKSNIQITKRTGYSFFRQQFTKFKSMQGIRLDFENLRLLCSILSKREKLKLKKLQTEFEIWLFEQGPNEQKNIQKKQVEMKKDNIPRLINEQIQVKEEEYEESPSSDQIYVKPIKISKAKKKFEQKQKARLEKTKKLIEQYFPKTTHNPNSAPEGSPQIKLKRELQQLILTQDRETYNLVVKKIKNDELQS